MLLHPRVIGLLDWFPRRLVEWETVLESDRSRYVQTFAGRRFDIFILVRVDGSVSVFESDDTSKKIFNRIESSEVDRLRECYLTESNSAYNEVGDGAKLCSREVSQRVERRNGVVISRFRSSS